MKSDTFELMFIEMPDEMECKERITSLLGEMLCNYLKTQKKQKTAPKVKAQIQKQLEKNRQLLETCE